jgi:hypothetical protein
MKNIKIVSLFFMSVLVGCQSIVPSMLTPTPILPTATLPPPTATSDPNSWNLVWKDEFELPSGSAGDPTKWNDQQGGTGWGNSEL